MTIKLATKLAPLFLLPLLLAPAAVRASAIYSYTGQNFNGGDSWIFTNHNVLGPTNTFSFTFNTALAANLVMQSEIGAVTAWQAEAVNTPASLIGSAVANSSIDALNFSTDALGNIIDWAVSLSGYTDDIYHNGILGKEVIVSTKDYESIGFYNPPGYISWPYRANGLYGYAYCGGYACQNGGGGTWVMATNNNPSGGVGSVGSGAALPEPASIALLGLGLAGLGYTRRRKD